MSDDSQEKRTRSVEKHQKSAKIVAKREFFSSLLGRLPNAKNQMIDGVNWPAQTLTELEDDDWGEPDLNSYVVTNCHRLRHKPLREFTGEDLRFMFGQQISLPILMPMALDVLQHKCPFVNGEIYAGALLTIALKVDKQFWRTHWDLWMRMSIVLDNVRSISKAYRTGRPSRRPRLRGGVANRLDFL